MGTDADFAPSGIVNVNGLANAATVTVTNLGTGEYKAAVTLPSLSIGDGVDLRISATVGGVADKAIVWRERCDATVNSRSTYAGGAVASITDPSNIVVGGPIVVVNNMVQSDVQMVLQSADAALGLQMVGDKFKADEEFDVHVMTLEAAAIAAIQSGLMLASSYTAPPSASTIASQTITNLNADSGYITLKANAGTAATTASQAATNTGTIITNLAVVDGIVDDIKAVTVKLDSMLVADGDDWQFTQAAGELFVVNVTLDSGDIIQIVNGVVAGLAGTEVNYTGPVLADGSVDLVEGDDYTSRPFTWTITGYTGPSLSGAAAVLRFIPMADYNLSGNTATAEVSKSFTLTQSGTTVTVSVAPTASDLTALTKTHPPLPSPNYKVQVKATSSNVTLVLANATRRRLIGPTA